MYKHILVATDGSKLSLKAIKTAANLAAAVGARLSGLYVMPDYTPPVYGEAAMYIPEMSPRHFKDAVEEDARAALAVAAKAAGAADLSFTSVRANDPQPWSAIIKTARSRKCDLIVMTSHARRGPSGLLPGSETAKVLTHSKVPVLVVR